MNNIESLLNEVDDRLNDEECVKEYFRLKEAIEKDTKLMELDSLVRKHQTAMCQRQNDDEVYFKEKALYKKYLVELESNPIYQNFNEVKKEVNALLIEVRDYLN